MTSAETSISRRRRPCAAEVGKAWWLLCQASPSEGIASQARLREWSSLSKRLAAEEVAQRVDAVGDVVQHHHPDRRRPTAARSAPRVQVPPISEAEPERGEQAADGPDDEGRSIRVITGSAIRSGA